MNLKQQTLETLLTAAVAAPSGHNSQPWLFTVGTDAIVLRPDFSRALPVVDPEHRELFISLGCALENLCLQASTLQLAPTVSQGADGTITVQLAPAATVPDPLAEAIFRRQSNRGLYDGRRIPAEQLVPLLYAPVGITINAYERDSPEFTRLAAAVQQGNTAQLDDPAFRAELLSWIRFNEAHSLAHRDGLSNAVLGAPNLPRWLARLIVGAMLNPRRQNRVDGRHLAHSSHLLLLSTSGDDRTAWIAAGRALQRLLLGLSAAGLAAAYLNQPCEMPPLRAQLRAELVPEGFPQILLRIGYGQNQAYSLRRPVAAMVKYLV